MSEITEALNAAADRLDALYRAGDVVYTSNHHAAAEVVRVYLGALHVPTVEERLLDRHGRSMRVFSVRQVVEAIRPSDDDPRGHDCTCGTRTIDGQTDALIHGVGCGVGEAS